MENPLFETSCFGFKVTVYPDLVSYIETLTGKETTIRAEDIMSVQQGLWLYRAVIIKSKGRWRKYKVVMRLKDKKPFCDAVNKIIKS